MPKVEFTAVAGPSSNHPHNDSNEKISCHPSLARETIRQPLLAKPNAYPNQTDVKEGKDYIVDVVFAVDPLNFFCQFVDNTASFNDLMERLATVYSGKFA